MSESHYVCCPNCNQGYSYSVYFPRGGYTSVSCYYCHKTIRIQTDMSGNLQRVWKNMNEQNESEDIKMSVCPKCGNELRVGAKFCGKCGTKIETTAPAANEESSKQIPEIEKNASFIHWNVLPGQLAIKIDSKEIASYGRVKGLIVQEGVRALFFVNGKITAELDAGSYQFKDFPNALISEAANEPSRQGGVLSHIQNFFRNVGTFFRGKPILPENVQNVSVVLMRTTEFPLVFDFKDVSTANIRSEVGLHFLCKISNINEFYQTLLLDRTFVSFENLAKTVEPIAKRVLNSSLATVDPNQVEQASDSVLAALHSQISSIYSFITVTKIISLTAANEALENIRKMQEELYVSELELTELTKRNSFLNRLQDENNAQQLREARSQTDFQAALDKIDQDKELNDDERLKFSQTLDAQRRIREAKTDDEVEAAMAELQKAGLLREDEIENIRAQLGQKNALRDLEYGQALALSTMANERELDRQKLQWEIEIGNKRVENQIAQERMRAAYEDERRKSQIELDKEEQLTQLELLRQAQVLRQERENAEHQRQMETDRLKNEHEAEMRRMFQNMTAEQILAANPDITPEAANAMAEKFKAEALAAQNDKSTEFAMKQNADMQSFMKEQMQMMRDMAMAGMNANTMNQQQRIADKDAEINRFANGVNNSVNAVSSALRNPTTVVQPGVSVVPQTSSSAKAASLCPHCGTPHEEGAMFCDNCGNSL